MAKLGNSRGSSYKDLVPSLRKFSHKELNLVPEPDFVTTGPQNPVKFSQKWSDLTEFSANSLILCLITLTLIYLNCG